MTQIQIRIVPSRSILDIDIPLIKERLSQIKDILRLDIFDDRASDATFITLIITFEGNKEAWARIKDSLLNLPRVRPFIVDEHGNEVSLDSFSDDELRKG